MDNLLRLHTQVNTAIFFGNGCGCERSFEAGSRDTLTVFRFENRAVGGADQLSGGVHQKLIGSPVQRPALVRTAVDPDAGRALESGSDQKHRTASALCLEFDVVTVAETIRPTKELARRHAVCLKYE